MNNHATLSNDTLYIAMISVHGLVRGKNIELGRDADTGGQVLYVVELAKSLSQQEEVDKVDLITRQIFDRKVDPDYEQEVEDLGSGAQIIRKPCGPKRYLRKEVLWPFLDEFANEILKYFRKIKRMPDIIHAHYADAGYVGSKLSHLLGIPLVFTGHSLGRTKRKRLIDHGMSEKRIEEQYHITERIDAEELALESASMVVASTNQEVEEQYKVYQRYQPIKMDVIPPGTDLSRFSPSNQPLEYYSYFEQLKKFLREPEKPMVLAISRADERKNIASLIQAYAEHPDLKEKANLVIVAGNRDDLKHLDTGAKGVIRNIFYLIDKYDLYGRVAYPKTHQSEDVPNLYRMCAKTGGVFVNPALTEPFGLTLIEAAASGVPIVATNDGGPRDIVGHCQNGILIDPLNPQDIADAIHTVVTDPQKWRQFAQSGLAGVKKYYSWESHTETYLEQIKKHTQDQLVSPFWVSTGKRLLSADRLLITDIDNTLLGDQEALAELVRRIEGSKDNVGFGIATGRTLESATGILEEINVPRPDLLITSVGTAINYGDDLKLDRGWEKHLNYKWKPEQLKDFISTLPGIELQPPENQSDHKISYYIDPSKAPKRREIIRMMRENQFVVKVIYSLQQYLDFIPLRASKGLAIWYLASRWGIPMERILTAGGSGNDEDMLKGHSLSIVVGNYSKELKNLKKNPTVYFAEAHSVAGILEGIDYFDFLGNIKNPKMEDV